MENRQLPTMTLTLSDDSTMECGVYGIFEMGNTNYICLVSYEDEEILYYRYYEEESPRLEVIDNALEDRLVREKIEQLFML